MIAALALLAAALLGLVLLVRTPAAVDSYLAGREAHAAHVAMNGAMAAMAWPALPAAGWPAILAVLAGGSVVLAVRALTALWRGAGGRAAGGLYHLFGMGLMTLLTPSMAAMAAAGGPAHAMGGSGGHLMPGMGAMAGGGHGVAMAGAWGWPASLAAGLFAVDGVATLLLTFVWPGALAAMQRRVDGAAMPATRAALRWSAIPHLAMDAGMVAMLV